MYTKQRRSRSDRGRGKSSGGRIKSSGGFNSGARPRGGRRPARGGRKMPSFDPTQFINKTPLETKEVAYVPAHATFDDFALDDSLKAQLRQHGLITPSPIQDQIIPHVLAKKDVIGLAETGTGKTAAFLLPLLQHMLGDPSRTVLIMTPTRELAIQIDDELKKFSKGSQVHSVVCVGGVPIGPQKRALRRHNHFIIGTPGRLLDLWQQGVLQPQKVATVVLDEADRMLDMGFVNDMRKIIGATPKARETLFFSATMTREAEKVVHEFLRDPVEVSVKKTDVTKSVEQDVVRVQRGEKFPKLVELLEQDEFQKVIVFGSMKHAVGKLADQLNKEGITATAIHGNKTHAQRQRALKQFKSAQRCVLTATDVAARGIHVDNVTHVINYDLPQQFDDYVHRIGRTGRGTKKGKALTFIEQG